jgi:hypothetical protein
MCVYVHVCFCWVRSETHWRQTVLFTHGAAPPVLRQDDRVVGHVIITKRAGRRRELVVEVRYGPGGAVPAGHHSFILASAAWGHTPAHDVP